jgi:hypothetical protein
MNDLYGKMTDKIFDDLATNGIAAWWNKQSDLIAKYGIVTPSEIYTVWKCKAIENFKGLFGVPRNGDGLYFEVTYHGSKHRFYLDVYKKQEQIVIDSDI